MSKSKITLECQEVKLLIQRVLKTIETVACRLSPPSLFPNQSLPLSSLLKPAIEPAKLP